MRTALRFGFAGLSAMACACAGSLPRPPYASQLSSALSLVPTAPPPPRVEQVPEFPARGAVWIDGEWVYRRGRWAWMLGGWVIAPAGAFFSPWAVVRGSDGAIYFAPGVWRDRSGKAVDFPQPIAVASVSAGTIVDAEGAIQLTGRTMRPKSAVDKAAQPTPQDPPDESKTAP